MLSGDLSGGEWLAILWLKVFFTTPSHGQIGSHVTACLPRSPKAKNISAGCARQKAESLAIFGRFFPFIGCNRRRATTSTAIMGAWRSTTTQQSALCERLLSAVRTIYSLGRTPEAGEQLRSIA
jgi:hypothetical protein